MKFFKNFRVTTAIRIISFFAMFAILVISIIGISDMNKINSNMDKMYKDRLLPSTKAADIRRDFILARMEATEAIFNNKSDADSAIQGYYKNINTNVDSLEQSFMPNDEKKIMADIKNGLTSYKQVWDVLNTNLKSGAKLSEDDINVEAKTADATIKRLGDLVKYNVDEANRLNNDGNTVYNNSKNIFITIGIGSYLILIILSFLIVGTIKLSIKGIGENLAKVSEGDFTIKIEDDTKNEFGKMNKLLMQMVQNVSSMMKSVKNNSDEIMSHAETLSAISEEMASSSQEVATTIQDVAGGANDQAKEIAQVNDTLNGFGDNMGEIVKAVKDVDSNAKTINKMSLESNEDMNVVAKSIEEIGIGFKDTKDKVSSLGLDISNINEITNLIMSISEQTNLLALNAAIEAARAGESGRGFAVVADEIRKLAEKSKESSENISALVGKITEKSNAVINTTENVNDKLNSQVEIIGNSIESFKKIVNAVGEILPKIENINKSVLIIDEEKNKIINNMETVSASAEEMSASSEEIAASMEEMNASSEEVASSAEKLNFKAKAMRETVEQFKLD